MLAMLLEDQINWQNNTSTGTGESPTEKEK